MSALITVTDATFAEVVLAGPRPVLVDFWAEWCAPCRPMARTLTELADEIGDRMLITKLNADENPEATRTYRVLAMPTLLLFEQGRVVRTIVGLRPKSQLRQALTGSAAPYVNR